MKKLVMVSLLLMLENKAFSQSVLSDIKNTINKVITKEEENPKVLPVQTIPLGNGGVKQLNDKPTEVKETEEELNKRMQIALLERRKQNYLLKKTARIEDLQKSKASARTNKASAEELLRIDEEIKSESELYSYLTNSKDNLDVALEKFSDIKKEEKNKNDASKNKMKEIALAASSKLKEDEVKAVEEKKRLEAELLEAQKLAAQKTEEAKVAQIKADEEAKRLAIENAQKDQVKKQEQIIADQKKAEENRIALIKAQDDKVKADRDAAEAKRKIEEQQFELAKKQALIEEEKKLAQIQKREFDTGLQMDIQQNKAIAKAENINVTIAQEEFKKKIEVKVKINPYDTVPTPLYKKAGNVLLVEPISLLGVMATNKKGKGVAVFKDSKGMVYNIYEGDTIAPELFIHHIDSRFIFLVNPKGELYQLTIGDYLGQKSLVYSYR